MLLELKKVFLNENESLNAEYEIDLSDLDFNGCLPFKTPVRVRADAVNRAGVVGLAVTAKFEYTAPWPGQIHRHISAQIGGCRRRAGLDRQERALCFSEARTPGSSGDRSHRRGASL